MLEIKEHKKRALITVKEGRFICDACGAFIANNPDPERRDKDIYRKAVDQAKKPYFWIAEIAVYEGYNYGYRIRRFFHFCSWDCFVNFIRTFHSESGNEFETVLTFEQIKILPDELNGRFAPGGYVGSYTVSFPMALVNSTKEGG